MLEKGIKNSSQIQVTKENTAKKLGSGFLEVFATPAMIALMESTAANSVQPFLDDTAGTVGTMINAKHIAATPVGMTVRCESELMEVDRRRLIFSLRVYDEKELIGEGIHERFIIDNEKFMIKASAKNA